MPDFISLCAPEKNSSFVSNFYNQGEFELLRVTPLIFSLLVGNEEIVGVIGFSAKEHQQHQPFGCFILLVYYYVLVARVDTI